MTPIWYVVSEQLLIVLLSFSVLTYQRNLLFQTERSFWADVVEKAPLARAYNNYGLRFLQQGDLDTALGHLRKSVEQSPHRHISHTNRYIIYDNLGSAHILFKFYMDQIMGRTSSY